MVFVKTGNQNLILKSGTDFRQFSINKLKIYKNGEKNNLEQEIDSSGKYLTKLFKNNFLIEIETEIKNINSFCEKNEKIEKIVEFYNSQLMSKFNLNIGYLYEIIDARFEIVREQNTPISNFIADLVNLYMNSEISLLNSGCLRMDSLIKEGGFNLGMLKRLFPMNTSIVKVKITGENLHKALENGVSRYPALEGRFPLISKMSFSFSDKSPRDERINKYL